MSRIFHQRVAQQFASLPDPCTGKPNRRWLRTFLQLPNGIPSHDAFGRVFARLDPNEFRHCFLSWSRAVSQAAHHQVIAVDGKQLRRSRDRCLSKQALTMVSAWATANRLVLGQTAVPARSNEIRAIPRLLRLLELNGCILTFDAIGCQTKIAATIRQQDGDYTLAVRENPRQLFQDVQDLFAGCLEVNFRRVPHDFDRPENKGHGRLEIRQCWTISDPNFWTTSRNGAPGRICIAWL